MGRRRRFIPAVAGLEVRAVLSQGPTTLGLSPVVSGLSPHLKVLNHHQTALVAEVNQAFDSFQADYDQARATFFASLAAAPTSSTSVASAESAFSEYTKQRTLLLSQQLVGSFVQSPQGTAKAGGQPYALKQLIESKVIGPKGRGPEGSLITSLEGTVGPIGGDATTASAPTTSLYTLSQDNAIQSARTAVLNGVSIIKHGAFGIQNQPHFWAG